MHFFFTNRDKRRTVTSCTGDELRNLPKPDMRVQGSRRAARALLAISISAWLSTAAAGSFQGSVVAYPSPNGLEERCIMVDRMPGGVYGETDSEQEKAFCEIDFYSNDYALCPKLFSTSPGTLVYDIAQGQYAGDSQAFEAGQCGSSSPVKRGAPGEPVSYKMTMNAAETSATFSIASLLYYHFSRYFDAHVYVPVSVYRSMDKAEHLARVTRRGLELSASRKGGAMNHAGWTILQTAEQNPSSYRAIDELFTPDRKQVFGVLLHPHGDRYGAEINGTRASGWGEGQNRDFQETAPYLALRSDMPLQAAIDAGIHAAVADRAMRQAMGSGVTPEQMVFWMKELTEITLLDFIFSQQDRIGNIDFLSYWYWAEDGEVRRMLASGSRLPDELAGHHAIRIKRTQLNDNDAGGRIPYANFAKKTRMLEKIRHYSADTYRRLIRLAADFESQGELYRYVRESFGLSDAEFRQVLTNTGLAAAILQQSCKAGALRFDLDPEAFLVSGAIEEQEVDCDSP